MAADAGRRRSSSESKMGQVEYVYESRGMRMCLSCLQGLTDTATNRIPIRRSPATGRATTSRTRPGLLVRHLPHELTRPHARHTNNRAHAFLRIPARSRLTRHPAACRGRTTSIAGASGVHPGTEEDILNLYRSRQSRGWTEAERRAFKYGVAGRSGETVQPRWCGERGDDDDDVDDVDRSRGRSERVVFHGSSANPPHKRHTYHRATPCRYGIALPRTPLLHSRLCASTAPRRARPAIACRARRSDRASRVYQRTATSTPRPPFKRPSPIQYLQRYLFLPPRSTGIAFWSTGGDESRDARRAYDGLDGVPVPASCITCIDVARASRVERSALCTPIRSSDCTTYSSTRLRQLYWVLIEGKHRDPARHTKHRRR